MLSTSWFVSPSGSDRNAGTLTAPFETIQAAANVAEPGDFVEIEAGTYHEEVVPAHSGTASNPIVYEAYNGQSVTISGADPITNWSPYSGNIYQAPMPWDLGEGNNEVFVNGQAINEARWPNTSLDLMHPTEATTTGVSLNGDSATIYSPSLTQSAGYWNGAIIHITDGQQWEAQTGTVTSSAPGQVTFSYTPGDSYELPTANNPFYLTGTFKALNSAGEWYRDPTTNQLYLWTPGSENPATDDIEVKARQYAFDLSNRSNITITNVNIFASTIYTNQSSANTVINGINATYISQYVVMARGWQTPIDSGIDLRGPGSLLENSTIDYSSGDGVFVSGAGSRVTNNIIHNVDYNAGDAAGIYVLAPGAQIDHNTIYETGRDGIYHAAAGVKILYNTIYDAGQLTTDNGGIYTVRTDGQESVIAYNTIYGMHSGGYNETGIYLDNNSSDYIVHDNVVYDVDDAMKLNFTSINEDIYNNTLTGSLYAVVGNLDGDWSGTSFANNILQGRTAFSQGVTLRNNSTSAIAGNGAESFVSGATIAGTSDTSAPAGSGGSTSKGSGSTGSASTGSGGASSTGSGSAGSTSTGSAGSTSTGTSSSGSTATGTETSGSTSTAGGASGTTESSGSTASGSGGTTSPTTGIGGSGSTTTGTGSGTNPTTGTGSTSSTGTAGASSSSTDSGGTAASGAGAAGSTSTGVSATSGSGGSTPTDTNGGNPPTTVGTGTSSDAGGGSTATAQPVPVASPPILQTPPVVSSSPPDAGDGSTTAPPTAADPLATLQTCRAQVISARKERQADLHQLVEQRRIDAATVRALSHELAIVRQAGRRVGATVETTDQLIDLMEQLAQGRKTLIADSSTIKADQHTDFTGIGLAKAQAASAARAYALARRRSAA